MGKKRIETNLWVGYLFCIPMFLLAIILCLFGLRKSIDAKKYLKDSVVVSSTVGNVVSTDTSSEYIYDKDDDDVDRSHYWNVIIQSFSVKYELDGKEYEYAFDDEEMAAYSTRNKQFEKDMLNECEGEIVHPGQKVNICIPNDKSKNIELEDNMLKQTIPMLSSPLFYAGVLLMIFTGILFLALVFEPVLAKFAANIKGDLI